MSAIEGDLYLVWSHEHGAWWGPGRNGYTRRLSLAGRYTRAAAVEIATESIPGTADRMGDLPELPVRLADVEAMRERFHARFQVPPQAWE
jgi:hypothetical protein